MSIILNSIKTVLLSSILFNATTIASEVWFLHSNIPTKCNLHGICFLNNDTGIVVGDSGTILRTIDRGATWTAQNSGRKGNFYAAAFANSQDGIILGDTTVFTHDAGKTFACAAGLVDSILRAMYLRNVVAVRGSGFFASGLKKGKLLKIDEMGNTALEISISADLSISGIAFTTKDSGWVVSNMGQIFSSTNSGTTWNPGTMAVESLTDSLNNAIPAELRGLFSYSSRGVGLFSNPLTHVVFALASLIRCGGDAGCVLATGVLEFSADGISWSHVFDKSLIDSGYEMRAGCFAPNGDKGIVVGSQGKIWATRDTGSSWEMSWTGIRQDLNAAWYFADSEIIAIGDSGTVTIAGLTTPVQKNNVNHIKKNMANESLIFFKYTSSGRLQLSADFSKDALGIVYAHNSMGKSYMLLVARMHRGINCIDLNMCKLSKGAYVIRLCDQYGSHAIERKFH
jgi:photosystem II stability/assembly factor-like uncharacterized protein